MSQKEPLESPNFLLSQPKLWIFGYGSIIWKPGFEFSEKRVGHIRGFVRRFWQGCVSHRGEEGAPGRVATLVKQDEGVTWGVAFLLIGQEQIFSAMQHLNLRETTLGGYDLKRFTFHAQDGSTETVFAYTATKENRNYLGPAEIEDIARSIAFCKGKAGPNTEYLFRLVEFMRENLPEVIDDHLYKLDQETKNILKCNKSINRINSSKLIDGGTEVSRHLDPWGWQFLRANIQQIPMTMY